MVSVDEKSYTDFYLKSAQEEIKLIRDGIDEVNPDVTLLHRTSHSLKGQSYFMHFHEIGAQAKQLEYLFKLLLNTNQLISQKDKIYIISRLNEIEKLIGQIKI